jgi:exonuclease SbcC
MYITRLELENIKSHAESKFEFAPGTTAITGENGAGKTTIIEAISWALFDVLEYKKDEFLRRGARKGSVQVTFVSGRDGREYVVDRDTGSSYYIFDPRLQMRIADKREDVGRFLRDHMGISPGTDLGTLVKHAVGVPQGTLTAIFLATPAERKKTFDTLLKVEEYRRGAEELLKTQRFVEGCLMDVRESAARAEGELGRAEAVEKELKTANEQAEQFRAAHASAAAAIKEKKTEVERLDEQERRIGEKRAAAEELRSSVSRGELILEQTEREFKESQEAAQRINEVRADADRYTQAVLRIKELERERETRDRLQAELAKIEAAEGAVRTEERHVRKALLDAQNAHKEIERLTPLAKEQAALDTALIKIRERHAWAAANERQLRSIDEALERLRASYTENKRQLAEAREKAKAAAVAGELQKKEDTIVSELARLRANLETDERFQKEVRNGLCPILSEKCLNINEGQTLEGFLTDRFAELRARISGLETKRKGIAESLTASRQAERAVERAAALEERIAEVEAEGKRLKAEREKITSESGSADKIKAELAEAESKLEQLGDPKGRLRALEDQMSREMQLRQEVTKIESNLERLESDRRITVEKLEFYKDLDSQWRASAEVRDSTAEAHRTFLTLDAAAGRLAENEARLKTAGQELKALTEEFAAAERAIAEAGEGYVAEQHNAEKAALIELQKQAAEMAVRLENAEQRVAELKAESVRLAGVRKALADDLREKERLAEVLETTVFIRDTLKEAAPHIARNYVFRISAEANLMFREITGSAERSLRWSEDYGIMLEEGGYERSFASLSGGEQMAAALSVRLALLKQLSDIRIAFFDEPTANMDAERRENLAMQIAEIKDFDQLFVISHDDTFEGHMDHEIRL